MTPAFPAEAMGFAAGALTTLAFVPQVIHAWRTRSTRDLSLATLVAFSAGITLWIGYGIAIASFPVIFWNVVTLLLNLGIVAAKLRHG